MTLESLLGTSRAWWLLLIAFGFAFSTTTTFLRSFLRYSPWLRQFRSRHLTLYYTRRWELSWCGCWYCWYLAGWYSRPGLLWHSDAFKVRSTFVDGGPYCYDSCAGSSSSSTPSILHMAVCEVMVLQESVAVELEAVLISTWSLGYQGIDGRIANAA